MQHLNYSHLLYFWTVAQEGSVTRAAEALHLTPQTISGQIKLLEQTVGSALFERAGRGLALTATGRYIKQYADEIFRLGTELAHVIQSSDHQRADTLNVGILGSIPKLIAFRTLAAAMHGDQAPVVRCIQGDLHTLLGDLAVHRLDVIISDQAVPTGLNVKAFSHRLGVSDISMVASPALARRYQDDFPNSLQDAPCLLPTVNSTVRRHLDDWFERRNLHPRMIAEFDDSALMKAVGEAGTALFPVPSAILPEVRETYGAVLVGRISDIRETYFAITPERKLKHPAVINMTNMARGRLFANGPSELSSGRDRPD